MESRFIGKKKYPARPVFIIANERTGPADVAASGLSKDFLNKNQVNNGIDYRAFFNWFKKNHGKITQAHMKYVATGQVDSPLLDEIISYLHTDSYKVLPILQLRIPSNHYENTGEEPEGFPWIVAFVKLVSMINGTVVFVDESTRSVSRSIEILYSGLSKRASELGEVDLMLLGKIEGITGQRGVTLNNVYNESAKCRVRFMDPWDAPQKPIPDDSEGFVPTISGTGIIEIESPGWKTISPFGVLLLNELWQVLIAEGLENRLNT